MSFSETTNEDMEDADISKALRVNNRRLSSKASEYVVIEEEN